MKERKIDMDENIEFLMEELGLTEDEVMDLLYETNQEEVWL